VFDFHRLWKTLSTGNKKPENGAAIRARAYANINGGGKAGLKRPVRPSTQSPLVLDGGEGCSSSKGGPSPVSPRLQKRNVSRVVWWGYWPQPLRL